MPQDMLCAAYIFGEGPSSVRREGHASLFFPEGSLGWEGTNSKVLGLRAGQELPAQACQHKTRS